jgi:tripartite-type tricarboxylate transporter receptor subunit TctC
MRSAIVSAIRIIALAAAALVLATFTASAQGWPSRPVTIIVPFPAGGTADLLTRGVAQALSDELGQQFVVDNRPGAGGTTGAAAVARAAPDGYTLLFASGSLAALNKFMFKNLPYDPTRDLAPVALVIKIPTTIVAGLDAPIGNFQDMVDYAKANPGKLSIGHAGIGSMAHITLQLLQQKADIVLTGVPYKGSPPMVTDLLGGHIPLASDLLSNYVQLASDKKVRLLAVASARRMKNLPDVPTVQELIHAPFEATAWFMVMAPAGTPASIVQTVNAITNRYLQNATGKELVASQSAEAGGGTPEDAAAFVKIELEKWEPVIRAANISLN